MAPTTTDTLRVPGAHLYHEVRGSGPVYAGLAEQLASRYKVLTYDRRGNSRSPLDAAPGPQSIDAHGDDAHRLLSAVGVTGEEPAYVFGNSSGAIIGLELAARHPEQVRTLVAHEPPLFELLPDRDRLRVVVRSVEETFVEKGTEAAGQALTAGLPMSGGRQENGGKERIPGGEEAPQGEPDKELMEMMARLEKNMEFFLGGFAEISEPATRSDRLRRTPPTSPPSGRPRRGSWRRWASTQTASRRPGPRTPSPNGWEPGPWRSQATTGASA